MSAIDTDRLLEHLNEQHRIHADLEQQWLEKCITTSFDEDPTEHRRAVEAHCREIGQVLAYSETIKHVLLGTFNQ